MPVTLDATVGGQSANSYLTVAAADDLASQTSDGSFWLGLTTPGDKEKRLMHGTFLVDSLFEFKGNRGSYTQALKWPRTRVYYDSVPIPSNVIPGQIARAVFEIARQESISKLTADKNTGPVSAVTVGPIAVQFKPDLDQVERQAPAIVKKILAPFIQNGIGDGARQVRVLR